MYTFRRIHLTLTGRWATEDPNPTAKVEEAARLVVEGEKGITKALDPEFVARVREMDELEGTVEPLPQLPDQESEDDEQPVAKRQRIEAKPQQVIASGILSSSALEGLKMVAGLKERVPVKQATKKTAGLANLAYGSDSD